MRSLAGRRRALSHAFRLVLPLFSALAASVAGAGDGRVVATPEGGEVEWNIHFRFPPTVAHLDELEDWVQRASILLCDATEGTLRIGTTRMSAGGLSEAAADFWYYFGGSGRGHSNGAPIHVENSRFYLNRGSSQGGNVIAHELGHLLLGLGDQYDEQRRWGTACGIGPTFDAGVESETNHSMMQSGGFAKSGTCQPAGGGDCFRDADCGAGDTCALPPLASELSTAANFDPMRGDNVVCPANRAGNELVVDGEWGGADDSTSPFDDADFDTAQATAEAAATIDFVDDLGDLEDGWFERSSHKVQLFADFGGGDDWTLYVAVDRGDIDNLAPEDEPAGGENDQGEMQVVAEFDLTFASSGTLRSVVEIDGVALTDPAFEDPVVEIENFESGASDAALTLDVSGLRVRGTDTASDLSGTAILTDGEQQLGNCTWPSCQQNWDTGTERWEASAVTASARNAGVPALSDWENLSANLPGWYNITVNAPAALPQVNPPGHCLTPVVFDRAVEGVDKVFLVIDRSGSMETVREVSGEARTRLEWAEAGASVFADLTAGAGIELGLISFEEVVTTDLGLRPIVPDSGGPGPGVWTAGEVKAAVEALEPDGATAIGDALDVALTAMEAGGLAGARGRAIYLLSDGQNNAGANDPEDVADAIRDAGIQVFSLPLGNEADGEVLAEIAETTQGGMIDVNSEFELPPVYAELYAAFRGETPVLERTPSAVRGVFVPVPIVPALGDVLVRPGARAPRRGGGGLADASDLPERESFQFRVLGGADRLNVLLSARADEVSSWWPGFELSGPAGELITNGDPSVITEEFYSLARVPDPSPGVWTLEVFATGPTDQFSYVLAHEENAGPDCYASAAPWIQSDPSAGVRLGANASFGRPLGAGVTYSARVTRPDGSEVTLNLPRTEEFLGGEALFTDFAGRGIYLVEAECRVGERARFTPGEGATPEEVDRLGRPPAFTRTASTAFFLDVAEAPPLPEGDDCDGDGIPNAVEGTGDTDGDGVVDACDADKDGDDLPDVDEEPGDADGDGIPNDQDPDSDNDGTIDGADDNPYDPVRFEYRYPAKLVCGRSDGAPPAGFVRGQYATTINVTNLNRTRVTFEKTLSLAVPPGGQRPGEVLPIARDTLAPGQTLAVDCADLARRLFPNGLPAPLIDGVVILRSPQSLEVTAVYTMADRQSDGGKDCCGGGGVGVGGGIDVEPVSERRIEIPPPPVQRLPNLVPGPGLSPPPGVPDGVPGSGFCEAAPPQGGPSRAITFEVRNAGAVPAEASLTRVVFHNGSGTTEMPTPALDPGESVALAARIPRGCYGPGSSPCAFAITADGDGAVTEGNEADNETEGLCLQPQG